MRLIRLVERGEGVGVHVEDGEEAVVGRDHGHDDLGAGGRGAGNVVGKLLDVGHELRLARSRGGAAHAAVEVNVQAPVRSLVRAHDEVIVGDGAVEARPVVVVERVVEFARHGGHRRHPVGRAVQ